VGRGKREDEPHGVVGGVHVDDVFSETESSLAHLVLGHDGAQVGHCFRVFVCVCDRGEGVGAAVILREGHDVVPVRVV
jgi:hypothetical protein